MHPPRNDGALAVTGGSPSPDVGHPASASGHGDVSASSRRVPDSVRARRGRAVAFVTLALVVAPITEAAAATLAERLAAHVSRSGLAADVSVTVRDEDGSVVYAHAPDRRRLPASNQKLLTSIAILRALGGDHRFPTVVASGAPPLDGAIEGDVYLIGGGDPRLATRRFARGHWRNVGTIERLAEQIRAAGVRRITGAIVGDGSRFDTVRDAPGWKRGFVFECAPLSALAVNGDVADGRPVYDPELRAARLLRRALVTRGVEVGAPARVGVAPVQRVELGRVESLALRDLVLALNKDSDNFIAEMLLKNLGAERAGRGTTAAGAAQVARVLAGRGLDTRQVRIADGSGLSAFDRETSSFLVALLRDTAADPDVAPDLLRSLPVAGVDGTLDDRMRRGPAHGVVRAKTGTLQAASALSGFARQYTFSILVEHRPQLSIRRARRLQDRIAHELAAA